MWCSSQNVNIAKSKTRRNRQITKGGIQPKSPRILKIGENRHQNPGKITGIHQEFREFGGSLWWWTPKLRIFTKQNLVILVKIVNWIELSRFNIRGSMSNNCINTGKNVSTIEWAIEWDFANSAMMRFTVNPKQAAGNCLISSGNTWPLLSGGLPLRWILWQIVCVCVSALESGSRLRNPFSLHDYQNSRQVQVGLLLLTCFTGKSTVNNRSNDHPNIWFSAHFRGPSGLAQGSREVSCHTSKNMSWASCISPQLDSGYAVRRLDG